MRKLFEQALQAQTSRPSTPVIARQSGDHGRDSARCLAALAVLRAAAHEAAPHLCGKGFGAVLRIPVSSARRGGSQPRWPMPLAARNFCDVYEALLPCLDSRGGEDRRDAGRFSTPCALAAFVAERTLKPLMRHHARAVRVIDPACGGGRFLAEAATVLREHRGSSEYGATLYGMDTDPLAVESARAAVQIALGIPLPSVCKTIVLGDAPESFARRKKRGVLARGAYDAVVGNPPWVSFSGREAKELSGGHERLYRETFRSFRGWRSLHGLFVELGLALLADGGRMGLVLPRQVCDLAGYAAVREAVRELAALDEPCASFGEAAFAGVVSPACAIVATRRAIGGARRPALRNQPGDGAPFSMTDAPTLDSTEAQYSTPARVPEIRSAVRSGRHQCRPHKECFRVGRELDALLTRLAALPRLPGESFGDPGVHSGNCATRLITLGKRPDTTWQRLIVGADIAPFALGHPRHWLNTRYVPREGEYFRIARPARYKGACILLRQTASRPVAALNDRGAYFRNSCLACYGVEGIAPDAVVALLNSYLFAWLHHQAHADARQKSFPQVKVSHLRALPMPQLTGATTQRRLRRLAGLSRAASAKGLTAVLRREMDAQVFELFGVSSGEQGAIARAYEASPVRI